MSSENNNRCIYIGSIPYDQTEEQVLDIAKSVGPVSNLRLLFDKDTGKSKGYAFVEYTDHETAASAVRNLNNYNIGNRTLKCSFSTESSINQSFQNNSNSNNNVQKAPLKQSIPPLPLGVNLIPGETYAVKISTALNGLDKTRLIQLVRDAKKMSEVNPVLMEELLSQTPQLAYALVEASLLVGSTTPEKIQTILTAKESGAINQIESTSNSSGNAPLQSQPPSSVGAGASAAGDADIIPLNDQQKELIKGVLELSDAELNELPADQRAAIMEIKTNAANGVYGNLY